MVRSEENTTTRTAFALSHSFCQVEADLNLLRVVMNNLLGNAVKYGSTDSQIQVRFEDLGEWIQVGERNTGPGVPAANVEELFSKFTDFVSKDRVGRRGIGLGLSMAQGIVEQSGGQVWVTSEPGRGSTFTICLPQAVRWQEEVARGEAADGPLEGWETILLVEDEDAVRRLVLKILRRYGYQALEARSGEEAQSRIGRMGSNKSYWNLPSLLSFTRKDLCRRHLLQFLREEAVTEKKNKVLTLRAGCNIKLPINR